MAKILLNIFVDYETLGKTINILTAEGVTGFYCIEYWGVSPQNWSGFVIKEEPEMAIG
ncbi:MAG: MJ1244 family protein, partial [Halobacteriota archaeon]